MPTERRILARRAAAVAVAVFSGLSLWGWSPLRRAEQAPAVLLRPFEEIVEGLLPEPDPGEAAALVALASDARLAYAGWEKAVVGEGPPSPPGTQRLGAPVVARDPARREVLTLVPAGSVRVGAPVTHRAVLVGFVAELRRTTETGSELCVIAPLGRKDLRAVAGEWQAGSGARPVQVLVGAAAERDDPRHPSLKLLAASSSVQPPPDQLCYTRDVSTLGDSLPAGLLLGRLQGRRDEEPGGAARMRFGDEAVLRPLLDTYALELLAIAGTPGARRAPRQLEARLLATSGGPTTARLDRGTRGGVRTGDWISQAGLYVGRVVITSGGSAIVDTSPPDDTLLCVTRDGEVRELGLAPESWPAGWQPARGDLLALGRPGLGGLLLGLVAASDEDGLRLERPAVDPARPVTVSGP